jgi:hypothetical protein
MCNKLFKFYFYKIYEPITILFYKIVYGRSIKIIKVNCPYK